MDRGVRWALGVYAVDLLIVIGVVMGWVPVHPIVIMLPVVGLLNSRVERRDRAGLGFTTVDPVPALALALVFAALTLGRYLISLRLDGHVLHVPQPSTEMVLSVVAILARDVFIIALYEETVNRGYIQTRLQAAWGFSGVIVATVLFVSLHIPSAVINLGFDLPGVLFRLVQVGLAGFLLAFVYWRTGSVLATIAIHGLNNVAFSMSQQLSGRSGWEVITTQIPLQVLWLAAQVGLVLYLCHVLFPKGQPDRW